MPIFIILNLSQTLSPAYAEQNGLEERLYGYIEQLPFLDFAIETAKEAGNILMQHFGNITLIEQKSSDIALLTIADSESETARTCPNQCDG